MTVGGKVSIIIAHVQCETVVLYKQNSTGNSLEILSLHKNNNSFNNGQLIIIYGMPWLRMESILSLLLDQQYILSVEINFTLLWKQLNESVRKCNV